MPIPRARTLIVRIAVCLAAVAACGAQEATPPSPRAVPGEDCSRWSIMGLRLGMSVETVRRLHPDLLRQRKYDGSGIGPARYHWFTDGDRDRENQIVADGEKPSSRIIYLSVHAGAPGSDSDALRADLVARWGPPQEPEGLERVLVRHKWLDPSCDAEAQLRYGSSPWHATKEPALFVVLRSIEAQARFDERKADQRQRRSDR